MTKEEFVKSYTENHIYHYHRLWDDYFRNGDKYLANPKSMVTDEEYQTRLELFDKMVREGTHFGGIWRRDETPVIKSVEEVDGKYIVKECEYAHYIIWFDSPNRFLLRRGDDYGPSIDYAHNKFIYFTDAERETMRDLFAKANMKALSRYIEINILHRIGYTHYGLY